MYACVRVMVCVYVCVCLHVSIVVCICTSVWVYRYFVSIENFSTFDMFIFCDKLLHLN